MGSVKLTEKGEPITVSLEGNKLIVELEAPEGLTMEKLNEKASDIDGLCEHCDGVRSAISSAIFD